MDESAKLASRFRSQSRIHAHSSFRYSAVCSAASIHGASRSNGRSCGGTNGAKARPRFVRSFDGLCGPTTGAKWAVCSIFALFEFALKRRMPLPTRPREALARHTADTKRPTRLAERSCKASAG